MSEVDLRGRLGVCDELAPLLRHPLYPRFAHRFILITSGSGQMPPVATDVFVSYFTTFTCSAPNTGPLPLASLSPEPYLYADW